ncbi:MAG: hypothetical protein ACRDPH_13060 [Marmoricola sp.]
MSRRTSSAPRQRVKVAHLVLGLFFLGLILVWGLGVHDLVQPGDVPVLLPLVLIVAGAIGLAAALVTASRHRDRPAPPPAPPQPREAPQGLRTPTGSHDNEEIS